MDWDRTSLVVLQTTIFMNQILFNIKLRLDKIKLNCVSLRVFSQAVSFLTGLKCRGNSGGPLVYKGRFPVKRFFSPFFGVHDFYTVPAI